MQWDHYEFKVAEHYLPALINAGESGMDAAESAEFNAWQAAVRQAARDAGFTVGHWADIEGTGEDWGLCDVCGLYAMRCTVRLMVYKPLHFPA